MYALTGIVRQRDDGAARQHAGDARDLARVGEHDVGGNILGHGVGTRYLNHVEQGSSVVLFARLRADERAFWCLGPATYVRHEGERPIAITWRLQHRLPADLYTAFAAAVA